MVIINDHSAIFFEREDVMGGKGSGGKSGGRPKGSLNKGPKIDRKKLQIVLPAALVDELEERARLEQMPKSSIVKNALEAWLGKRPVFRG